MQFIEISTYHWDWIWDLALINMKQRCSFLLYFVHTLSMNVGRASNMSKASDHGNIILINGRGEQFFFLLSMVTFSVIVASQI